MNLFNVLRMSVTIFCMASLALAADPKATSNSPAAGATQGAAQSATTSAPGGTAAPAQPGEQAEEVEVEDIKKKYWAMGNKYEMGVVQDRLYPKRHRFEFNFGAGSLIGDPFLTMHTVGGSIGFHVSEFFSVHLIGWDALVTPSSALTTLQSQTGVTANTNDPKYYVGLEARGSLLYGKLSLVDSMILYFDTYFAAGGGRLASENCNSGVISVGVGEQIHITKIVSLNLEYNLMWYQEKILANSSSGSIVAGQDLGWRSNYSNLITLSVSTFVNFFE
jgi:outer membrane beta-barrel protein